jgi:glycyl-tRNA synthetase beta subunit
VRRLQAQLHDEDYRHDVIAAVLAEQGNNPAKAHAGVAELSKHVEHKVWPDVLDTYARCARITRDLKSVAKVDEKLFEQDEEKQLFAALIQAEKDQSSAENGDVLAFLKAFMPMMPAIKAFFNEVLVNAEDEKLRINRLALLQRITALANGVADFSMMEGF